jgi:hypothetical protein
LASQLSSRPDFVDNPADHRPRRIHALPTTNFLVALDVTVTNLSQRTTNPVQFRRARRRDWGGPGPDSSICGAFTAIAKTGRGRAGPG